jgi:hypothetical protein
MVEEAISFETLVRFFQTTRYDMQEDSHLHTRRLENLNFHNASISFAV